MSKIIYIKPKEDDSSNSSNSTIELNAEVIGNDIDILAEIEQNTHVDDYDENNIFGY